MKIDQQVEQKRSELIHSIRDLVALKVNTRYADWDIDTSETAALNSALEYMDKLRTQQNIIIDLILKAHTIEELNKIKIEVVE